MMAITVDKEDRLVKFYQSPKWRRLRENDETRSL